MMMMISRLATQEVMNVDSMENYSQEEEKRWNSSAKLNVTEVIC